MLTRCFWTADTDGPKVNRENIESGLRSPGDDGSHQTEGGIGAMFLR